MTGFAAGWGLRAGGDAAAAVGGAAEKRVEAEKMIDRKDLAGASVLLRSLP